MEKKRSELFQALCLLFCFPSILLAASQPTIVTKPAATKEAVDKYYQEGQFSGFLAMAQNLQAPIRTPEKENLASLPGIYGSGTIEERANNYYKGYGLTYAQAVALYNASGKDQRKFRENYGRIKAEKPDGVSIELAISAYLSENRINQLAPPGRQKAQSSTVEQQRTGQQPIQQRTSGQRPPSTVQPAQLQIPQQPSVSTHIEPPTDNTRFGEAYYKRYGITLAQAQRLYELAGKDAKKFELGFNNISKEALQKKISTGDVLAAIFKKVDSGQNPIPGRPLKNIWTQSIFSYIPAFGGETVESRADAFVHKVGHLTSDIVTKPLGAINLWTESEYLDKGGYTIKNPNAGKKFTLLDAVDAVMAYPLVRVALEATVIGPLDKNKDLKMRQFIMMLLVTHYNGYKLILSPLGALNMAVNRILFPIRAVSSVAKVSMFLMRQAVSVFNQYNLNGGSLGQALENQAASLVLGKLGMIVSGTAKTVSGIAGAVRQGFGSLFKAK